MEHTTKPILWSIASRKASRMSRFWNRMFRLEGNRKSLLFAPKK